MQMDLEYVAQNEPEGTEVIWSEEENKGTLLLPSTASLEGIEKTKPGLSEAHIRINVKKNKNSNQLTSRGFACWVVCLVF